MILTFNRDNAYSSNSSKLNSNEGMSRYMFTPPDAASPPPWVLRGSLPLLPPSRRREARTGPATFMINGQSRKQ
jgi:hypothetical protein